MTKFELAANPNTPTEVLIELSKDENNIVRHYVTANPNTPMHVLIRLCKEDDDFYVVSRINIDNFPLDILIELSKHKRPYIAAAAKKIRMNRISLLK